MGARERSTDGDRQPAGRARSSPPQGVPARTGAPLPAQALALQRAVGNRTATRVLTRWAAHPDKDKKGVLMPDAMAAEYGRFNPPLSK